MLKILSMRSTALCFVLLSLVLLAVTTPVLNATTQPISLDEYSYYMAFDREGFTTTRIMYQSYAQSGSSWVAVPKNFTSTSITVLQGSMTETARQAYFLDGAQAPHPFYDRFSFRYESSGGGFTASIEFNLTYGAVIVEPNAFFLSAQIGVPPEADLTVQLTLPEGVYRLLEVTPRPVKVVERASETTLTFRPRSESRIAMTFRVSWSSSSITIFEGGFTAAVPQRYANLAESILRLYRDSENRMVRLFGTNLENVEIRFFVPSRLPDIGIGGYTPIDPSSFRTGSIFLNLVYFRGQPGVMEVIALHELSHQFQSSLGIAPSLLWVHEGLANYVAISVAGELGYDSSVSESELLDVAEGMGEQLGQVQYWTLESRMRPLFEYYAASYKIFKSLGDDLGGLDFYSKFFREVGRLSTGLNSSDVAVYILSRAANEDLYPSLQSGASKSLTSSPSAGR